MKKIIILLIFISTTMLFARPKILVTGYWNPTGQMITKFSTNSELNPNGWEGENWEDLGYDVYSYFPNPDGYTGMFEIDYQSTLADFSQLVEDLNPIAIVSFGAGTGPWEIEYNARNLDSWVNDYVAPQQPTPNPPDQSVIVNYTRHSTLPINQIAESINEETEILAWIDWNGNPGAFLCEYIAYLGMWYKDSHSDPLNQEQCLAAGFIHVNNTISANEATVAADITIRETLNHLNEFYEFNGTIIADNIDITDVIVSLAGDEQYVIFPESNVINAPYIKTGNYKFSAVADGFFYGSQNIVVDSTTTNFQIEMTQWLGESNFGYHAQQDELFHTYETYPIEMAIRLTETELQDKIGNLIGKIELLTPASSDDCNLEVKIYSSEPAATEPQDLLCSFPITDFEANETISRVLYAPVEIEAGKNYWIGYSAVSEDGNIAWLDNQDMVQDKGAWINMGIWYQLNQVSYSTGNWMIDAVIISPETPIHQDVEPQYQLALNNYPNPFNPTTSINYTVSKTGNVKLAIYNIKGQLVNILIEEKMDAGSYYVNWNGKDVNNKQVGSGLYFYQLVTNYGQKTNKMILLK